jgi:hypothetical protein
MARAGVEGAAACGILRKTDAQVCGVFSFLAHARQGNPAEALRDVSLFSYSLASMAQTCKFSHL